MTARLRVLISVIDFVIICSIGRQCLSLVCLSFCLHVLPTWRDAFASSATSEVLRARSRVCGHASIMRIDTRDAYFNIKTIQRISLVLARCACKINLRDSCMCMAFARARPRIIQLALAKCKPRGVAEILLYFETVLPRDLLLILLLLSFFFFFFLIVA